MPLWRWAAEHTPGRAWCPPGGLGTRPPTDPGGLEFYAEAARATSVRYLTSVSCTGPAVEVVTCCPENASAADVRTDT